MARAVKNLKRMKAKGAINANKKQRKHTNSKKRLLEPQKKAERSPPNLFSIENFEIFPVKDVQTIGSTILSSSNNCRSVKFIPGFISDTLYREKIPFSDLKKLFYTAMDEMRFAREIVGEQKKAKALGMTWMDWINQRIDDEGGNQLREVGEPSV